MPDIFPADDERAAAERDREGRLGGLKDTMRRRRRPLLLGSLLALILIVAFTGMVIKNAFDAKSGLEAARSSAQQAKSALQQGESEEALRFADEAGAHAQDARDATHSFSWSIASFVPFIGSPFETGRQISDVVLGLASDVLKPAAQTGTALSPDRLIDGSRVNVQMLRDEQSNLNQLADSASRLDAAARAIPDAGFVAMLDEARNQLQDQTGEITGLLDNTALAAKLAPAMMGADGPRNYFMAFQTNAEARGTGGLLGGFGVLNFDNGQAEVDTLGANTELDKPFTPIDLGVEFEENYGYVNPFGDYRNSNLSSHFPYAAQIWKSMWAQQTGMTVDGVIALDPFALSYILGAAGPVTMPDGEQVTKDNVVELTESVAYKRFPTDQVARKRYLQEIAGEVVKKLTKSVGSPQALLKALGRAVGEGRIAVWSSVPAEQEMLEKTPLAHVIPDDEAPYAAVVLNNLGGNKMDYYLEREIEYVADKCDGSTRKSTVTVRLTNAVPEQELPEYVAGSGGLSSDLPISVPNGTMVTSVRLLATKGATLESALSNGERVQVFTSVERNHPTFEIQVAIPPGQSGELTFRLSEPSVSGEARVPVQPLVDPVIPKVAVPECTS